ncbi:hypothetical protein Spb1_11100 [Planctopirus ephydatiae]|jgi:hypothetical protein|uniref:Sulfatase n=1 Tax=Planctopirus ephydatiae TaxID=2528019 RepID=A0A518GLA6_9PLAN|nr:DUF1501 domain-containing protein [Planctopirus ephydatiae]QDV29231.1 hypothetical protein Spb1_11100 [Planctopirus ephydatiae]
MTHCLNFQSSPTNRREYLAQLACGFGGVALAGLATERGYADVAGAPVLPATHHAPKAKNIIFLYMDGGPSQMDLFDPKPRLTKEHGEPMKMKVQATQFDNNGKIMKSPWEFTQHGESGLPFSSLIPHIASKADDLCVIRSMTSAFSEHTNANYFLHTGHGLQGRPSMGAWVSYGLGTECQNLPGFLVLNGGLIPPGGVDCFHNGFLPATHQGSILKSQKMPISDLEPSPGPPAAQKRKLDLLKQLDQAASNRAGRPDALESAIANYELAFRMQTTVPQLVDLATESEATQKLYGLDSDFAPTRVYARQCLLARRLVESGVRFIELTCPGVGVDRWDQHGGLKNGHELNCKAVDQPIAALLTDLKSRGLLDQTLVVFAGEFGRTPQAQGADGRDHNPFGYTVWMAGGGVKGGMSYGQTDEYGYYAIDKKLEIHDLHATMLWLMGIDHTKLTVRFGGRDMRLTDVFGHVVHDVIA